MAVDGLLNECIRHCFFFASLLLWLEREKIMPDAELNLILVVASTKGLDLTNSSMASWGVFLLLLTVIPSSYTCTR